MPQLHVLTGIVLINIIDAINEMAVRYGFYSKEAVRDILNKRIIGKMSDTVREIREE